MWFQERYLVIFSIATSLLSAVLVFVERFVRSVHEIDLTIIFFSGIFVLIVIMVLLFFLVKGIIKSSISLKKKEIQVKELHRKHKKKKGKTKRKSKSKRSSRKKSKK